MGIPEWVGGGAGQEVRGLREALVHLAGQHEDPDLRPPPRRGLHAHGREGARVPRTPATRTPVLTSPSVTYTFFVAHSVQRMNWESVAK